jgi:diguanylate cyclase (GGDEF)-like protein
MDTFDSTDINSMHTKLQNVANSMTQKISENTTKLEKNRSEIDILKDQVLKLEIELRTTRHENEIDHLTSVLTRKAYEKHVSVIEEKFKRTQNDYAIIFFDIDHFKKVNDTYGHEAGDLVLSTFAKVLLRSTRDIDIIGRYGGEEFIGIINYKKEEDLITYILRIKNLITKHLFKYKEHKISITFSAGVTIRSNNNSYEEALNLADELLYKAKNSGRNKIIFQSGIEL